MVRVLGIGDNTIDIYVDKGVQFPGGNAVNVSVLCKRLGAETSYLGSIGADFFGSMIRDALIAEQVDISHLRTTATPNSWSRIRHSGKDRVFDGSRPLLRGSYNLEDRDFEFIAGHDLSHSSIYSKLEDELERISAAAPALSFDYSDEFDSAYLDETAPHVDIAFLSDPDGTPEACHALCREVSTRGPHTVIITRGQKGAIGYGRHGYHTQPPVTGPVVDTLAAGDGFIAGFLMTWLAGDPLPAALASGAANAIAVCGYQGAFGHGAPIQNDQPGLEDPGPTGRQSRSSPDRQSAAPCSGQVE